MSRIQEAVAAAVEAGRQAMWAASRLDVDNSLPDETTSIDWIQQSAERAVGLALTATLRALIACTDCGGKGRKWLNDPTEGIQSESCPTCEGSGRNRAVLEWLATHYKEPGDEEADEEFVRDIGMDGAVLVQLYSDEEIYSAELAMKRLIDLLESEGEK